MPTYLLTWNPKQWQWEDIAEIAEGTAAGEPFEMRWSLGNRKSVELGSRVFLIRQGMRPKGIIAAGTVNGPVEEDEHWDSRQGRRTLYAPASYERILNPAVDTPLDVQGITSGPLAKVYWGSQASGILIPPPAAALLEELWAEHIGELSRVTAEIMADADAETFPEGNVLFRLHRHRERNKKVVEQAKAAAMKRDGRLVCCVCRFDFAAVYGSVGEGYIEGHHTLPLSELTREGKTRIADIALCCSNCHRMLHRRRPWLTTNELKRLLVKR